MKQKPLPASASGSPLATAITSVRSSKRTQIANVCAWPNVVACRMKNCVGDPMRCQQRVSRKRISRLEIEEVLTLAGRYSMDTVRDQLFNMLTGMTDGKHEEAE